MVQYKLHYFPVRGRGEFIRYILHYADVPHEEVVVTFEEWRAGAKQKTPLGITPTLELQDGRVLSQSLVIARYLAKKHGLTHGDDFQDAWGDQFASTVEDIYPKFYFPYVMGVFENNEEKKKAAWEDMKTKGVEPMFEKFEKFLGDKKWFCGDKVHWSDLVVAEFVDRMETVFEKGFVSKKFPKLYSHCQRVHELPRIKQYVEKRQKYDL